MKSTRYYLKEIFLLLFGLLSMVGFSQTKLIEFGAEWRYYDKKEAPPNGWKNSMEVTANWAVGKTGLGYGDIAASTTISFGDNPKKKIRAYYFSKSIFIEDPFQFVLYQVRLIKDDGIVLYLNGKEIFREDMPLGKITHKTKASKVILSGEEEDVIHSVLINPEDLNKGENIISASVHQGTNKSVDLIFNLEFLGHNDLEKLLVIEKERTIENMYLDLKLKDLLYNQKINEKNQELISLQKKGGNFKAFLLITTILFFAFMLGIYKVWKTLLKRNEELQKTHNILKDEHQMKGSEMMNVSLNSLNNKQLLKVIKRDLEESLKEDELKMTKREINRILNTIDSTIDSTEDWDNFKKHFDVVHSGYIDKLTKLHPSLTDVELRHCIFIKLHMQTKEIANILHIDPRSVQSSRYRIKKKMELEESVNLKEYLVSIS